MTTDDAESEAIQKSRALYQTLLAGGTAVLRAERLALMVYWWVHRKDAGPDHLSANWIAPVPMKTLTAPQGGDISTRPVSYLLKRITG